MKLFFTWNFELIWQHCLQEAVIQKQTIEERIAMSGAGSIKLDRIVGSAQRRQSTQCSVLKKGI